MTPKTKKILGWTGGILAALGLGFAVYKLITRSPDGKDGKADDFEEPNNTATDATSGVKPGSGLPAPSCGTIKTNYDGDFDYVKCSGVWYTKSKPAGGRPNVYPNWVSLANNATATQRLNTKYPNG